MRNIYTGIDIGSDSIKIVIAEKTEDRYLVLATVNSKVEGIRRGLITDLDKVEDSMKIALSEAERKIGFKLTKALVSIPSLEPKIIVEKAKIKIYGDEVSSRDISNVLEEVSKGAVDPKDELVCVTPIMFSIDKKENIKKPLGQSGKSLGVNAVIVSTPKKYLYPYFSLFNDLDIEIIDLTLNTIADYATARDSKKDDGLGAVVNIGEDMIDIAVFNKGIMIKTDSIKLGSRNVDRDISYVYGVELTTSRKLKERFAYASKAEADANDTLDLPSVDGGTISINQKEVSEVSHARIKEMLELAKKSINNLTNRKISYIIVTGGLSELLGFEKVVDEVFGLVAKTLKISELGIRHNSYSSAYGIIKYYNDKMDLRGRNYSMVSEEDVVLMMNNINENVMDTKVEKISKVSNYFIQ